jgi:hypothetical protein
VKTPGPISQKSGYFWLARRNKPNCRLISTITPSLNDGPISPSRSSFRISPISCAMSCSACAETASGDCASIAPLSAASPVASPDAVADSAPNAPTVTSSRRVTDAPFES